MLQIIHRPPGFYAHSGGQVVLGRLNYSYPEDDSGHRNLQVDLLSVDEDRRRQGIGTALMKALLEYAEGRVLWVSLWTGEQAEIDQSWSLFLKLGFSEGSRMPDYYRDGVGTRYFFKRMKSGK